MNDPPPPPWVTQVELVLWWQRGSSLVGALVRYRDSPVGPYSEVLAAARDGWRLGVPFMAVDSGESRTGGRLIWALPKQLAAFDGSAVSGEGWRIAVDARSYGPVLPLCAAVPVRQPGLTFAALFAGRFRPAQVSVTAAGDTPLTAGRYQGLVARGRLTVLPPRHA